MCGFAKGGGFRTSQSPNAQMEEKVKTFSKPGIGSFIPIL